MKLNGALTTSSVGKLLGVCTRTVAKWADSGMLDHYRTPVKQGRRYQHRRFTREAVVKFCVEYGVPLPEGWHP